MVYYCKDIVIDEATKSYVLHKNRQKYNHHFKLLYVLIMPLTRFRVNPHCIVAWMSRKSLLEAGVKSEVQVTATGFEPRTTYFINEHWAI